MRRRFSIRDLLWLTVVAGLAIGWWLDHREQVNRFEAMNGPLSIQVYSITVADPNAVLKVLQTMLAGTQVRLMVDTKSNFMVAYATPSQHAMIRTLVDKLEGKRNRQHQVRRQIRCRTSRNMKSLVPIIRMQIRDGSSRANANRAVGLRVSLVDFDAIVPLSPRKNRGKMLVSTF